MLSLLKIKNLALVEQLEWTLHKGLTAITGETGAGKSVIIGALKLIMGDRADKAFIRSGEKSCIVEASFQLEDTKHIDAVLEGLGLNTCEDGNLIIRRLITTSSSRQFVNDSSTTLGTLRTVTAGLIDLHGPHDHQTLFSQQKQLSMLDSFASAQKELTAFSEAWNSYQTILQEYNEFCAAEVLTQQEVELYQHQLDEISEAEINLAEVQNMEARYELAQNSSKIVEVASQAATTLTQETGLLDSLAEFQRKMRELEELDQGVRENFSGLDSAIMELQEAEHSLEDYVQKMDIDQQEIHELEETMNRYETLKRKYGPNLEDVLDYEQKMLKKLESSQQREEKVALYQKEIAVVLDRANLAAKKLSDKRRVAAPKLAKKIREHLKDLGFKQAVFEVILNPLNELSRSGIEEIDFFFGPNPGETKKPLRQIASSGEMSRVMLSLKTTLADHDKTPIIVFDEIDANVGGEIAAQVGEKMNQLSAQRQVLSITHFPQVAAIAPSHCLVKKSVENNRTTTSLHELNQQQRIDELVRMLGSGGDEAIKLAESLLRNSDA